MNDQPRLPNMPVPDLAENNTPPGVKPGVITSSSLTQAKIPPTVEAQSVPPVEIPKQNIEYTPGGKGRCLRSGPRCGGLAPRPGDLGPA